MKNQNNKARIRQCEDSEKIEQLKVFVKQSKYINVLEQRKICASFGLPYLVSVFRKEYTRRFTDYLKKIPSTRAEVFKATGIDEKYLCQVKRRLEKQGLLVVICFDRCKATNSINVQRLSTNPEHLNNAGNFPLTNQLKMF